MAKRKEFETIETDRHKVEESLENLREKVPRGQILNPDNLEGSEMYVVRRVQGWYFAEEIHRLQDGKSVLKSSPLFKLDPFLEDGILRVGGRLSRSDLRFEAKHPILLPKLSHISSLLVQEAHRKVGHMGRNAMRNVLDH